MSAGVSEHGAHACAAAAWSSAVYSEMVKKDDGCTYQQNEGAGHNEANTAARKAGGSRMMSSVRAPVLVLHKSKHSAQGEREEYSKRWCTRRK